MGVEILFLSLFVVLYIPGVYIYIRIIFYMHVLCIFLEYIFFNTYNFLYACIVEALVLDLFFCSIDLGIKYIMYIYVYIIYII